MSKIMATERIRKVAENHVRVTPVVTGIDTDEKVVRYLDEEATVSYGAQRIAEERTQLSDEIGRLERYDPAEDIAECRAGLARLNRVEEAMARPVQVDE